MRIMEINFNEDILTNGLCGLSSVCVKSKTLFRLYTQSLTNGKTYKNQVRF